MMQTVENGLSEPQLPSPGSTQKAVNFNCKRCGADSGHPFPRFCDACENFLRDEDDRRRNIRVWTQVLGGQRAYEDFTLESFREAFPIPPGFLKTEGLYIHGPTGVGKTHLAVAIARTQAKGPNCVEVVKPHEIFRRIRASKDAADEIEKIEWLVEKRILVLDDLGVSKDTDFAFQTLYEVIDGRYMALRGGLIVTSNLSLNDLAAKLGDDRIPSRLAEMCRIIHLTGKDRRLEGGPE